MRLLPFAPFGVFSAIHVVFVASDHALAAPTKLLLMPLLIVAVWWASASIHPWPQTTVVLLSIALVASWMGDGAGTFFATLPELPVMIFFFGIAHVIYMYIFVRIPQIARRRGFPLWSIGFVAWMAGTIWLIGPHTNTLLIPVIIYGLVLGGTAILASRCGAVIAWGGIWFLISDTILAFMLFLPDALPQWAGAAVMFTYCLGQGLIAYGVLRALRGRVAAHQSRTATQAE